MPAAAPAASSPMGPRRGSGYGFDASGGRTRFTLVLSGGLLPPDGVMTSLVTAGLARALACAAHVAFPTLEPAAAAGLLARAAVADAK